MNKFNVHTTITSQVIRNEQMENLRDQMIVHLYERCFQIAFISILYLLFNFAMTSEIMCFAKNYTDVRNIMKSLAWKIIHLRHVIGQLNMFIGYFERENYDQQRIRTLEYSTDYFYCSNFIHLLSVSFFLH